MEANHGEFDRARIYKVRQIVTPTPANLHGAEGGERAPRCRQGATEPVVVQDEALQVGKASPTRWEWTAECIATQVAAAGAQGCIHQPRSHALRFSAKLVGTHRCWRDVRSASCGGSVP